MSTLYHSYSMYLEIVVTAVRQEKVIKGIQIGKENIKLYCLQMVIMLYSEDPRSSIQRLLDLINKFNYVVEYKSTYKNQLLFSTPIIN